MPNRVADYTDAQVLDLIKKTKSVTIAASEMGVPRSTLSSRYQKIIRSSLNQKQLDQEESEVTITEQKGMVNLVLQVRNRIPPEEILSNLGYDLKIWEIVTVKFNQWTVAGKKRSGQDNHGRWKPEELWEKPLYQATITIKRRSPKFITDAIELLMEKWSAPQTVKVDRPPSKSRLRDPHALEISLFDVHFGKLAWGLETGTDYDVDIARDIYLGAINDLLNKSSMYNVEKIIFPLGQDFFNVDNWRGETANGTLVESTDDRFSKVFETGVEVVREALLKCLKIAPVEILWSPGNHDRSTSWYLCKSLQQYFIGSKNKYISFDLGPNQRKYVLYGNTLLGFTHCCDEKMDDLPLIMAKEAKDLWSKASYHQWHVGHYHKKKETKHIAGDTYNGVSVIVLPSLTATDSFHYRNGWIKPLRAAEAYLWSKKSGLASFIVHSVEN